MLLLLASFILVLAESCVHTSPMELFSNNLPLISVKRLEHSRTLLSLSIHNKPYTESNCYGDIKYFVPQAEDETPLTGPDKEDSNSHNILSKLTKSDLFAKEGRKSSQPYLACSAGRDTNPVPCITLRVLSMSLLDGTKLLEILYLKFRSLIMSALVNPASADIGSEELYLWKSVSRK